MAQSTYTPIILFHSTTPGATPTTANLNVGELALNIPDGKLYFTDGATVYNFSNATGGGGTVTDVSVVSANGLAGTVATSTTTPAITLSTTITGILQGNGTAISAASTTGSGSVVLANTPTLVTPLLGTPTSGTLTNCTGLPISTGVSGLATGMATFLATPTSANLAATMTDETGSGLLVFGTSPTISGLTIDGANPYINMTPTTAPAYQEGRVFYDSGAHTLNYYNDNNQMSVNIGQEQIIRVRNLTGSIVPNGTVVYINGASANAPTIALAQANTFIGADIIGVTTTDINNNGFGYVTINGLVNGLDTSTFVAGDRLFLSPTTPGAYTTTEPTAPNYSVQVGVVTTVDATVGAILVSVQFISTEAIHIVGTIGISQGGTGQTTATAAFNALSPITTTGDLILGNGANSATRLGIGTNGQVLTSNGTTASWAAPATSGTVTSVSFTGGIVSVANPTTTPALTVAGTSGGIPYFSSGTTWASSTALAANSLVIGGGAGAAPSSTTTGTGVLTALGLSVGTAGSFVVDGGALGTPSSGVATNLTGTASGLSIGGNAATVTNGVYTTDTGTVTNTMLAGSIANSKLSNSTITINGSAIALGGSVSVGTVTSVTGTAPVVSSGGATPAISMAAANTTTDGYLTSTDWNTFNNKGSGTVTSVSVVTANGFAGTVATATSTPAITISTGVTGLLYGNGTAVAAASAAQVVAVIGTTAVTNATNAANVTLAAASAATNYVVMGGSATGNVAELTDTAFTFNATTHVITGGISGGGF